jgi:hypothetical protein
MFCAESHSIGSVPRQLIAAGEIGGLPSSFLLIGIALAMCLEQTWARMKAS